MTRIGLSVAVANASELVIQHADMTTIKKGGHGAVREFCEFLIKAQGNYDRLMAKYLE